MLYHSGMRVLNAERTPRTETNAARILIIAVKLLTFKIRTNSVNFIQISLLSMIGE